MLDPKDHNVNDCRIEGNTVVAHFPEQSVYDAFKAGEQALATWMNTLFQNPRKSTP
jgi:hypothetical protein